MLSVFQHLAVDTHVFRVAHRLGIAHGKTPEKVEEELMRFFPSRKMVISPSPFDLSWKANLYCKETDCEECPVLSFVRCTL